MTRFEKRNLIWLLLCVLVIGMWLRNQNDADTQATNADGAPLLLVQKGLSHLYDEQGKTNTLIRSPLVHHYQDQRGTHYTQPELDYYQNDSHIYIRANQAVQNQEKTELLMSGDVFATRQIGQDNSSKIAFSSDQMRYLIAENQADTDSPVIIRSADSTTHAIGTIWHLNQNLFILKRNVRSYYAPNHNL